MLHVSYLRFIHILILIWPMIYGLTLNLGICVLLWRVSKQIYIFAKLVVSTNLLRHPLTWYNDIKWLCTIPTIPTICSLLFLSSSFFTFLSLSFCLPPLYHFLFLLLLSLYLFFIFLLLSSSFFCSLNSSSSLFFSPPSTLCLPHILCAL